jgi:hypothetical protein
MTPAAHTGDNSFREIVEVDDSLWVKEIEVQVGTGNPIFAGIALGSGRERLDGN